MILLPDNYSDERHDKLIRVTVLDTQTGKTASNDGWTTYDWTEGNFSCDCNRSGLFVDLDYEDNGPCSNSRYLVVRVEPLLPSYTLKDFNEGYPVELVAKCLPEILSPRDKTTDGKMEKGK